MRERDGGGRARSRRRSIVREIADDERGRARVVSGLADDPRRWPRHPGAGRAARRANLPRLPAARRARSRRCPTRPTSPPRWRRPRERTDRGPMSEAEHPRAPAPPLELPDTAGESALAAGRPGGGAPRRSSSGPATTARTRSPGTTGSSTSPHDYAERGVRFLAVNSNDAERYPADGPEAMRERVERERLAVPVPVRREPGGRRAPGARRRRRTCSCSTPSCGSSTRARPTPTTRTPRCGPVAARGARRGARRAPSRRPSTEPVGCSIKWR